MSSRLTSRCAETERVTDRELVERLAERMHDRDLSAARRRVQHPVTAAMVSGEPCTAVRCM